MAGRVAITGGSGHIGANLCRHLLNRGIRPRVLVHRDRRALEGLDLDIVQGDLLRQEDLVNLFSGVDVVFHLACRISLHRKDPEAEMINEQGTSRVIEAVKSCGVRRLVHFSSIHAFNQHPLGEPLDESRPMVSENGPSYDRSKARADARVMAAVAEGLDAVIVAPTAVIGPHDYKPSYLGSAILRFYKGMNPALVRGGYNWVDIRDVVRSAVQAAERGRRGQRYLLPGHWHDLHTLAREIHLCGGAPPPALEVPAWLALLGTPFLNWNARLKGEEPIYTSMSLESLRNSHRNISGALARKDLGHSPRPFAESLRDTIEWYKKNDMIR